VKICAIIPAYNEERHIAEVVRGVVDQGVLPVVVNDCSQDATAARARSAGAEVISHDVNRGKGAALATGLCWARDHGYVAGATLDGDGQHDPAELPRFVAAMQRWNAHIVVGRRVSAASEMPSSRKLTNRFMSMVLSGLAGQRLSDTQSGYRLITIDAWSRLGLSTTRFDTESEMLVRACRLGMVVKEVPIRTIYGDEQSDIRVVRDTVRWVKLVWRLSWRR
jgi:glycosyltransferase involved in cell wall biosynthesis